MTIKFPRTYEDLKKADYVFDVEICTSGGFIYIEEKFIQDHADKTAWGEKNLKQALQMLKIDFWDSIKKYYKEVNK